MKDDKIIEEFKNYKSKEGLNSEIKAMMQLVPHGNSDYQDINLAIADSSAEGRLKHALLNLQSKQDALDENVLQRQETLLELEETEQQLNKEFKKFKWFRNNIKLARLETKITRLKLDLSKKEHLYRDCMRKIELFYAMANKAIEDMQTVGVRPSLENWEKAQHNNWLKRLKSEAFAEFKGTGLINKGHMEAMHRIGVTADTDRVTGQIQFRELTDDETKFLTSPEVISKEKYEALVNLNKNKQTNITEETN